MYYIWKQVDYFSKIFLKNLLSSSCDWLNEQVLHPSQEYLNYIQMSPAIGKVNNFYLCSAFNAICREGSLMYHVCCDTGHRFSRSLLNAECLAKEPLLHIFQSWSDFGKDSNPGPPINRMSTTNWATVVVFILMYSVDGSLNNLKLHEISNLFCVLLI